MDRARAEENAPTAFPTSSLDGAQNAPPTTAHKACFFGTEEERKRNDYNDVIHSRRLIDNTDAPRRFAPDHDRLECVITMGWTK